MAEQEYEIGLIGLGEMGRNLALNMADHGFSVAVYNRTPSKTQEFMAKEVGEQTIKPGYSLAEFITLLRRPRAVLMMISACRAVDDMIQELLPLLEADDLIIDGGNSLFSDTDRRRVCEKGLLYLGLGISGGGLGARYGPSLMPGGFPRPMNGYVRPLEAIAAKVDEIPCVSHLGSGSAGHYVKMVHNGIEYGLMQLIAETYHLLKQGLGLNNDDLSLIFNRWNQSELKAYLIEITARIFRQEDEKSGGRLIDQILDQAGQEGTGMWTSMNALELKVPVPTIDLAVIMRDLSDDKQERQAVSQMLGGDILPFQGEQERFVAQIGEALYGGMILTYSQGLTLLRKGSLILSLWFRSGGSGPHLEWWMYHSGLSVGKNTRRLPGSAGPFSPTDRS